MDDSTPTKEWPAVDWQNGQKTPTDANTPVEHRFLLRLRDNPDDLAMRMVFADWLEETGQAKKAEIVRLLAEAPAEHSEAAKRLYVLSDAVTDEWIAIVTRTAIEKCDSPFKFQCPTAWESLTSTDDATIRHCSTCDQAVFFCTTLSQVRVHGKAKRCVAFSPKFMRSQGLEEYEGDEMMMLGEVDVSSEWFEDVETQVR
jgi:uncharacterized protein (TIGR02996 family)